MFKSVLLIAFCLVSANATHPVPISRGETAVAVIQVKELVLSSSEIISLFKSSTELAKTCEAQQFQKYLGYIVSDTVEVVKHVGWDICELIWGTFVCVNPYFMGWCFQLDYPKAMLFVVADIPVSLVKYVGNALVLLEHIVTCIL